MNKSWNSSVEEPKSLDPSASGNMSQPTVTPAPTRRAPPTVAIPANATLPVVTNTVATPEPTFSFDPSKVKLASSSSSPPVPAITTRLSVKSSTFALEALIPPFASTKPVNVDIPLTKSLAEVVTPETTKSPNTVAPIPVVSNFSAAL